MFIMLDFGMDLVEARVSGVLPSRDSDGDQTLLVQIVAQGVSRVRKTLEMGKRVVIVGCTAYGTESLQLSRALI